MACCGSTPCATSRSSSRCTRMPATVSERSGRTISSSRWLVSKRLPTMRTAPIETIRSFRTSRPVVSQSSATHSSAGGSSYMNAKCSSAKW